MHFCNHRKNSFARNVAIIQHLSHFSAINPVKTDTVKDIFPDKTICIASAIGMLRKMNATLIADACYICRQVVTVAASH